VESALGFRAAICAQFTWIGIAIFVLDHGTSFRVGAS
jgi:hypothetical protein